MGGGIIGLEMAEVVLANKMGASAEDLALSIHPHPTLSEMVAFSADAYLGTMTDGQGEKPLVGKVNGAFGVASFFA
ncbi:MAG: hypothetical protein ACU0CC_07860 [Sagittula sp.]|uniref:hypothetical protein n=1 Tax=Sagittula sp. TaxID=2038081 RepID=UPI004059D4EA